MARTPISPSLYADVFEDDKRGAAILDELIAVYGSNPYVKGGADAARQTDFNAGTLEVVQFILRKINRAHGVNDDVHETTTDTE